MLINSKIIIIFFSILINIYFNYISKIFFFFLKKSIYLYIISNYVINEFSVETTYEVNYYLLEISDEGNEI